MRFKYEHLIKELGVGDLCPPDDLKQIDNFAYRWVFEPINNEFNLLPNYEVDKLKDNLKGYKNGIYSNSEKCLRCSLSMYVSLEAAKINHKKLPGILKGKLGYTHVAKGKIESTDGKATKTNSIGHFSFFEAKDIFLKAKFSIIDTL